MINLNNSLNFIQTTIELDGVSEGRKRYFDYLEGTRTNPWTDRVMKRSLDKLAPGQVLVRRAIEPAALAIVEWFQDCLTGKAGPGSKAMYHLAPFFEKDPEDLMVGARQMAYLTLKVVLAHLHESRNACILTIAQHVHDELELEVFRQSKDAEGKEVKGLFFSCLNHMNNQSGNAKHKAKALRAMQKRVGIDTLKWDANTRATIGTRLFNIVAGLTGWVSQVEEYNGHVVVNGRRQSKSEVKLVPTPEFAEVLDQAHEATATLEPVFPPMVVPPKDWTDPYTGAYLTDELSRKVPLVKTSNPQLLKELAAFDLTAVYEAINTLQKVPYRVNKTLLATVNALIEARIEVPGLPAFKAQAVPTMPCEKADVETFKQTNPEEWKAWLKKAAKVYEHNLHPRRASDLIEVQRVLGVANDMKTYEALYFPLQMDFRGRVYPVSNYLHPQGNDLVKSLLEFSEGKALGEDGHIWLAIAGANTFAVKSKDDPWLLGRTGNPERSLDKCDFDTRYDWVVRNEEAILECAKNPLDCNFWHKADSPFQFLAFCFEWAGFKDSGADHVSHMPCPADGACNGIQHWAALMRCEVTAPKVCLVDTEEPGDIYSDVAEAARELVREDLVSEAAEDRALASFWLPKIDRSLMKRAVMTSPYGLTSYGMRQQFKKMLKDSDKGDSDFKQASKEFQTSALNYLNKVTERAMEVAVRSASVGMAWLKVVATALASDGIPINWTTPDGFPVWQGYPETTTTKVKTYLNGQFVLKTQAFAKKEDGTLDVSAVAEVKEKTGRGPAMIVSVKEPVPGKLSRSKNANSIAPNVVHSLDAAALRGMVLQAKALGVTGIMTIHDSFSTHACDYVKMASATRDTFVWLHTKDFLQTWFDEVTVAMSDERLAQLKAELVGKFGSVMPVKGSLDLEQVRYSEYFFA